MFILGFECIDLASSPPPMNLYDHGFVMYSLETVPIVVIEDRLFKVINRVHNGPSSTFGDGDCGVHSVLQSLIVGSQDPDLKIGSEAAKRYAERNVGNLRKRVSKNIANSLDLRSHFTDENMDEMLRNDDTRHRCSVLISEHGKSWKVFVFLLGFRYKTIGIWFNFIAMRCTAITLDRDIVVIDVRAHQSMTVYPRRFGAYHIPGVRIYGSEVVSIYCSDKEGEFIPRFAFHHDTLVLAYNGGTHFWYSKLADSTNKDMMLSARVVDLIPKS